MNPYFIFHISQKTANIKLIRTQLENTGIECKIINIKKNIENENSKKQQNPDVILMDYQMKDELFILKQVKSQFPEVPVIFYTADNKSLLRGFIYQESADGLIKQEMADLSLIINQVLKAPGVMQESGKGKYSFTNNEETIFNILENIGIGIVIISPDMKILKLNKQMQKWFPDIDPAQHPICYRSFNNPPRKDICPYCPTYLTLKDGKIHERTSETPCGNKIRNYKIISSPLFDDSGNVVAAIEVIEDITERKQAEKALKEKQRELLEAQHLAHISNWWHNLVTGELFWSDEFFDIIGQKPEKPTPELSKSIIHPDDFHILSKAMDEAATGKAVQEHEFRIIRPDGGIRWIHNRWVGIYDNNGKEIQRIGTHQDITKRKLVELELIQKEQEYRTLVESLPDFVIRYNKDLKQIYVNQAWEKASGLSGSEVINIPYTDFPNFEKPYGDDYVQKLRHVMDTGESQSIELSWINAGNVKLYLEYIIVPEYNPNGKIAGVLAVGRDITERKKAEQQIALLSFAMNNIHEAAFLIDKQANFQYVNDEACLILGYSRKELLTKTVLDVNTEFSKDIWASHWNNLIERKTITFDTMLKKMDGGLLPVEVNANYFEYEGQGYDLGLVHDISDRKQIEHERIKNLKFFENMDRINRAIHSADNLKDMMKDLLDTVMLIFNSDRAFLLFPCDPESPTWTIPMECTKPEYPGALELNLELPMDSQVAETLRVLLDADGPVTFGPNSANKLPENVSKQFNIKSFMSMAIYPKTGKPWQFGIHQCSYERVWTKDEIQLFEIIGGRLSDSLSSLLGNRDLHKSEEFLNKVIEHIPDMLFVKDAKTFEFMRLNKAGEQLLGYSREELLGKTDYDFYPKELADFFRSKDLEAIKSGQLVDIPEETLHNRGDEERILHTKKLPILDETGNPQYVLGITKDITEQKKAEESIIKLSQAIEQSPVSIVITDIDGSIEFVNTKFTHITGYTEKEAIGKNPRILKSGEMSDVEYKKLWETISSGGTWEGEFHNIKKNGELFWEHATISPIKNKENIITHYVAVKEDITERKKLEEQYRQSQKMEAIGQLAGGIAHDFNNMLGVIIGYAEMALENSDLDESQKDIIEQILFAGQKSAEITQQLLAFARKQTIAPKILELNNTIENMLKLLRHIIGEDIDLVWVPGKALWPIKIDPAQADQVLANLCLNAKDAINGIGKVTIETRNFIFNKAYCFEHPGYKPGEYVMLAVSDNGTGMDNEEVTRIFEPFYTTKGIGKGTGLGLAMVYGIVKQNNGFINVYSEPGEGSTFKIYLPRHASKAGILRKKSKSIPIKNGSETILIVEDNISILKMSKLMLVRHGYKVLTANSPIKALCVVEEYAGAIDLLITDVIMPEMNGRELADKLKEHCPDIKTIFMSGYTANVIAHHGVLDSGLHFMQKPFSSQELLNKVQETIKDEKI